MLETIEVLRTAVCLALLVGPLLGLSLLAVYRLLRHVGGQEWIITLSAAPPEKQP